MTDRERLRLFDALLAEGVAVAEGEAGDTETVRRWAHHVHLARLDYQQHVEEQPTEYADASGPKCRRVCEPAPAAPAVPVCREWCGYRNGHVGCVSAHESRLCKGKEGTCACSDACAADGHPLNPPPKETPK